jgi:hypothetical protein
LARFAGRRSSSRAGDARIEKLEFRDRRFDFNSQRYLPPDYNSMNSHEKKSYPPPLRRPYTLFAIAFRSAARPRGVRAGEQAAARSRNDGVEPGTRSKCERAHAPVCAVRNPGELGALYQIRKGRLFGLDAAPRAKKGREARAEKGACSRDGKLLLHPVLLTEG